MIRNALLIVLLTSGACFGGTREPSVPDQRYIEYGEKHECVVPIYGNCDCGKGKPHHFAASAVVISPRWVITAAHVVKDNSGVKVRLRDREFSIRKVVVNRHFKENTMGLYDIAMCESEEDMELDFYPQLYDGKDEGGKVASICGYGITGTFGTGAHLSDGRKRAGSNIVRRTGGHVMVCSATDPKKTNMEFMISHGDSGGGLFIDQKLAGINSFVSAEDRNPNSSYGDECHHTRISLFVPWIEACMRGEDLEDEVEAEEEREAE
jgi:hypothetical protein